MVSMAGKLPVVGRGGAGRTSERATRGRSTRSPGVRYFFSRNVETTPAWSEVHRPDGVRTDGLLPTICDLTTVARGLASTKSIRDLSSDCALATFSAWQQ